MSASLPQVASDALVVDWKIVASAIATGLGTLIITIWGWMKGQQKARQAHSDGALRTGDPDIQVTGAVLQDNTSLKENTQAQRELRDQLMLLRDTMERDIRSRNEQSQNMDDLMSAINLLNRTKG